MLPIDQLDPSVFLTAHGWIQLLTLTVLEVVLGIDNIIVISILSGELPKHQQRRGRRLGLGFAMITRVLLLLSLSWMMRLTEPIVHFGDHPVTGKDLVLVLGGLFLIWKAGKEIFDKVELVEEKAGRTRVASSLWSVVAQIILLDIVFSLDSVITAVGMSNEILIMVLAVIIAVIIMLFASEAISTFVNRHATVKVLALTFLALVGIALFLDGIGVHISKNYIYAAMGFSVLVELLNLRMRRNERRMEQDD
ncbi:MAG: TerC family protein [Bacteroidetes bacterium]|nr:TerC family protein [Bacteroidota bacterium]